MSIHRWLLPLGAADAAATESLFQMIDTMGNIPLGNPVDEGANIRLPRGSYGARMRCRELLTSFQGSLIKEARRYMPVRDVFSVDRTTLREMILHLSEQDAFMRLSL